MRYPPRWLCWLLLFAVIALAVHPALAAPPSQDGGSQDGGGDGGGSDGGSGGDDGSSGGGGIGGVITSVVNSIVKHIIYFPVESMRKAVEGILVGMISDNLKAMAEPLTGVINTVVMAQPQIIGENAMWGGDIFVPTWNLTIRLAIALWPAVLAVMAAVGAKNAVLSSEWGMRDLKDVLFAWLIGAVLAGASLEAIHLANRCANAVTDAILTSGVAPGTTFDASTLATALILLPLDIGLTPVKLFLILVLAIIGFVLVLSLIFQYVARFALLFVLVSLSPLAFTLGILPPLRWLQGMWLRGLALVLLLGPANALLLKLAWVVYMSALALQGGPLGVILRYVTIGGIVSILLAVNTALIRAVFGAIATVASHALDAVVKVAGVAAAGIGGAAAGGIGGAAMAGAGSSAGGAGGMSGAGGAATGGSSGTAGASGPGAISGGVSAPPRGGGAQERDAGVRRWLETAGSMARGSRSGVMRTLGSLAETGAGRLRSEEARLAYTEGQRQRELADFDRAFEQGANAVMDNYRQRGLSRADLEQAKNRAYPPMRQAFDNGQSLPAQARQAGFSRVEPYVASRVEGQTSAMLRGSADAGDLEFRPDLPLPATPGAGSRPDRLDFEQGYRLAASMGVSAELAPDLAAIHHGLRAYAVNPEAGYRAAGSFAADLAGLRDPGGRASAAQGILDRRAGEAGISQAELLSRWQAALGKLERG